MSHPVVRLRPGRDRSLRRGHPWVLSGSIAALAAEPADGETVELVSAEGERLGFGDWDADSQIRVRVWGAEPPEDAELAARIQRAIAAREPAALGDTDAVRLVHAEADGLPGLTIDRYGEFAAVRLGTPAMARREPALAKALQTAGLAGAWVRGPDARPGRALFGDVPDAAFEIRERARRYRVDLRRGQKTGFYLDQRDARDRFQALASGRRALDLFAYTGGFSVAALAGRADSVTAVESSEPAAALLRENAPGAHCEVADVGRFLRAAADTEQRWDLIALDPPPLAKRKRDVQAASRAYKDLHLQALRVAAPGAHLLSFTCSHHIGADLFRKIVFGAALDAGRALQVLGPLSAPPDHPVSIFHPEGEYLNGLWLRVGAAA